MNAPLTIPDLEENTLHELQMLASSHGRTVETEAREVLTQAVTLAAANEAAYDQARAKASKQAILSALGCVDGAPDLSTRRGFER